MNTDIRLLISFKGHPKRRRLEKMLGDRYLNYLIDLWLSAAQHRPDGILKGWDEFDIAFAAGWEDDPILFVNALVKCGWLDVANDKTYILHNWQKHQGWCVGSEYRSNKARILALVKHHGKEMGYKIAAEKYNIRPADFGYDFDEGNLRSGCDTHAGCNADRMLSPDAPLPTPSPSPSVKLIPLSIDKGIVVDDKISACPHEKIINAYHSILPTLPQVRAWPDNSKRHLRSRWRESPERQSIEFWIEFFKYISNSSFLMGDNSRAWTPDLLWIVKPTNFAKILNGSYHNDRNGIDEYRKFIEEK